MGVGFAKDAESQNKKNRKLLEHQRNKYFKNQTYNAKRRSNLNYKSATQEQLNKIRLKLAKQKERTRLRIITLLVTIMLICIILYLL